MRDLTHAQFGRRLALEGFERIGYGLPYFRDARNAEHSTHYGAILRHDWNVDRRATLAHLLNRRREYISGL